VTTQEELRRLLAEVKSAREESLRLVRENRAEMRSAEIAVRSERADRERAERAKTEAVLARLRAGGPQATQRAICLDLRVSPKRVVRLRALLLAERHDSAGRSAGPGPAGPPRTRA